MLRCTLQLSWVAVRADPLARQISNRRSRYTVSDRFATAVVIVLNRDPREIDLPKMPTTTATYFSRFDSKGTIQAERERQVQL